MILHGYFRSSAAWRVRIALHLKGLPVETRFQHLGKGEQLSPAYKAVNPQGLIPSLVLDDGAVLTQSLAICEYLDEAHPEPPLLPGAPLDRARVRAFAQVIACDIHPVQNLRVLKALQARGQTQDDTRGWAREVISGGFDALETLAADRPGPFAFGDTPTLADICLVPQMANARRFGVELRWPRLSAIETACLALPAFSETHPDRQPDAE
ncbi:maleylacetoacetate isomerase [Brevundimonas subvibrioides]|uniref:Maleylacetoacetate isomerase n=1 Tax=Brevundimonas subvibrioides (strain ATCC 15264 / DSM 4735 / LMG 14903 / NBRC 16000 / CB 81) TaxID=633149 RepID=D9QGQ5_BRESC|nr:maleylacetoacetate isomerase [Brevundimonas subvibrioides]ADL00871.1 maleylacetoacetate isomerase [Brevundimonas subvibrioides ATCC 15264]